MRGGLLAVAIAPHAPRLAIEDKVAPFQHGLIRGLKQMGQALRALKPDVLLVNSAHWVATFNWYATTQDVHQGVCVAQEAPELIPGMPYQRRGDPELAQVFIDEVRQAGIPALANDTPHYQWDYGALVPLLYLDPEAKLPVVQVPTVLRASLDESTAVGRLIPGIAERAGKRVVLIASTALSHALVRGPNLWPTPERIEMDRRFIGQLERGDVDSLLAELPAYCRDAAAEMGGRVLALMSGTLDAMRAGAGPLTGRMYGEYAQSSGTGNASIAILPASTAS